ncbi:MAG TPA: tetratricopeptide repeat protein [Roseiflexaceae bacterium]|nr:tetratricopeptide repeat protein [Roseiflexaceae bacterium]
MIQSTDTYLPPVPQTGREAMPSDGEDDNSGLWSQLLARFRDLSGSFDPFANDAHADVRALGRIARQRRQPQANDYFAIGDTCARLTLHENRLSSVYAAKTIAAYARAAQVAQVETRTARKVLASFVFWAAEVANLLGDEASLQVGTLVCDRARQINFFALSQADAERLGEAEQQLNEQIARIADTATASTGAPVAAERESRLLCDQGQMLLRQSHASEALAIFERAVQANDQNHSAWLWRAMALTDLGRFDDALASYDHALALDATPSVWNSKGALLMELGRLETALECFEHALGSSAVATAQRAAFWLNKGKVLFMLGKYQQARDALVRSHQLDASPESAAGIAACRERMSELVPAEAVQ